MCRQEAQELLAKAEVEDKSLVESYSNFKDADGVSQIVRNGYLPEIPIQRGVGPIKVKVPRVRDRSRTGVKFTSALIPPYLRLSKNIAELLPVRYLRGISTGGVKKL